MYWQEEKKKQDKKREIKTLEKKILMVEKKINKNEKKQPKHTKKKWARKLRIFFSVFLNLFAIFQRKD